MHYNSNVNFSKQQKRLHALGKKTYPSVHAILAFKGKCAVEKEGMIGEIKLKCRKKNISNRRKLLPVMLAKMLSRCSVRIHRCTGSPADYPNAMLRFQGSCPATVASESSAAQSSSELSGSPVLAGQPWAFLQYLQALLPKGLWQLQRPRGWRGDAGQSSLPRQGLGWWELPRHYVTNNMGACCSHHPKLLTQTYRTAQTLPACTQIISRALLLCTAAPFPGISPVFCTRALKSPYLHRSNTPGLYLHWQKTTSVWTPRLHHWCCNSHKKPENLLKHQPHINIV